MKYLLYIFTGVLFTFSHAQSFIQPNGVNTLNKTLPQTDSIRDILDDINFINSSNMPKPSKNFRSGHMDRAEIDNYLQKTDYGFIINLKSNSNIPSPAISNGKIHVSGGFGSKKYFAFDAFTGEKIWAKLLDDDGPSSAAIVDGISVFNTESCTIFACDENTGEHLWSYWLGDPLMSMPSIAEGQVFTSYPAQYIRSEDETNETKKRLDSLAFFPSHVLISFELKTGKILWQKWIDGDIMSAPVLQNGKLIFSTFTGSLYQVQPKSGDFISAKQIRATSAPILIGNKTLISLRADKEGERAQESIATINNYGRFINKTKAKNAPYIDYNVQDNSELKEISINMDSGNGFVGGAPASSGAFYAKSNVGQSNVSSLQSFQGSRTLNYKENNYTTQGNKLICSNAKNSDDIWSLKINGDMHAKGGFMATPPLEVNGRIIIATIDGKIFIINSETGEKEKTYTINHAVRYQPVVSKGWIYASTVDGYVVAINTRNEQFTGWSMWGGNAARTNVSSQ